jgi:hypothetical protein
MNEAESLLARAKKYLGSARLLIEADDLESAVARAGMCTPTGANRSRRRREYIAGLQRNGCEYVLFRL